MRRLQIVTVGCFMALAHHEVVGQAISPKSEVIPLTQRTSAPDFTIKDVHGKPFVLAAQKGQVVLLDFWAIACGGCKLELPWYVGFDQQYRSKGLALVGLDMYGEAPEAVRSFAAAHQMHYPRRDWNGRHRRTLSPRSYAIDRPHRPKRTDSREPYRRR